MFIPSVAQLSFHTANIVKKKVSVELKIRMENFNNNKKEISKSCEQKPSFFGGGFSGKKYKSYYIKKR